VKRFSVLIIICVLLVGVFALCACGSPSEPKSHLPPEGYSSWDEYYEEYYKEDGPLPTPTPPPSPTPEPITEPTLPPPEPEPELEPEPEEEEEEWLYDSIIYKITGTADRVNVTLFNDEGGIEQYSNVSIPHEYEYDRFDNWYASILAQNQGESGSVIVTIYLNGKAVKTSKSTGAYVIAEASLSLY